MKASITLKEGDWKARLHNGVHKREPKYKIAYGEKTIRKWFKLEVSDVWVVMAQEVYTEYCQYSHYSTTYYGWTKVKDFDTLEEAKAFKKELENLNGEV